MSSKHNKLQANQTLSRVLMAIFSFASVISLMGGEFLLENNYAVAESATSSTPALSDDVQPSDNNNAKVNVNVNVKIATVLSLAAYPLGDHSAETDLVVLSPVPGAGLVTSMLDLVVRTNVPTGYQLTIRDEDESAAMVNTTYSDATIPALESSTNTAGFPANRWGYSVGAYDADNSEFHAVPTSEPSIIGGADRLMPGDEGDTTTVTFGVKVAQDIAAGIYEDKVVFTASPKLLPSTYQLTIHYRYEDGTEAASDHIADLEPDEEYSVNSPEITGYYPSQEVVSGVIGSDDIEVTVTYSQYHSVTVKYVYLDGTKTHDDVVRTGMKPGETYSFTTPAITGYYPDKDVVSGTMGSENIVETVTYRQYYTATVKFVNEAGTEVATSQSQTDLKTGDSYSFTLPSVTGYYTDTTSPLTGTISNGNVNLQVVYKKYYTATVNFTAEGNCTAPATKTQGGLKPGDSYSIALDNVSGCYTETASPVTGTISSTSPADFTTTVTYKPYLTLTVKAVKADGTVLQTIQTLTNQKAGQSYSVNLPAISGYYTDEASPKTGTVNASNLTVNVVYKPYYSVTVSFVYEGGGTAATTETRTNLKNGASYSVTVPAITGYYADTTGPITGTINGANVSKTVTYKPYRTATITYKDTSGTVLKTQTTQGNLKTGASYSFTAPAITGYVPQQATYTGTVPANNFTVNMVYNRTLGSLPSDGSTPMQDFSGICAATTTPAASATTVPEATLTDSRDSKKYKVRKLADGKCWMVQDLNFSLSTSKTLTPNDTDITSNWTPNNNTQTSTGTVWQNPSATTARSYTNGTRVYYNWRAATAGSTSSSFTSGNAPGSICPKGWTLPDTSDYGNLVKPYGTQNYGGLTIQLSRVPFNFEYTGRYDYSFGTLSGEGYAGQYWTRLANVDGTADSLYFDNQHDAVNTSKLSRGSGAVVRCVAK